MLGVVATLIVIEWQLKKLLKTFNNHTFSHGTTPTEIPSVRS